MGIGNALLKYWTGHNDCLASVANNGSDFPPRLTGESRYSSASVPSCQKINGLEGRWKTTMEGS